MANKGAQNGCPPFSREAPVKKRNVFRCSTILNSEEQVILSELQETADRLVTLLDMAHSLGSDHPEVIDKLQEYLEESLS